MTINPVIFREYDIRGVVDSDFDCDFAFQLGQALCSYVHQKTNEQPVLSIGYDARKSSPSLAQSIVDGIIASGGKAIELGLVTSPINYFSTFTMPEVNGAIMVTGSHNPPEYNGFKLSFKNSSLYGAEIQVLKNLIDDKDFLSGEGSSITHDIFPSYLQRYKEEFTELKDIPIVLDCANGAAGCIARRLYETVGLKPHILFEKPDGDFPNHHPDPTVEKNLKDLAQKVKETGSLVGIGFDGDADRIGLVDENGTMVYGDELIALCSRFIIDKSDVKTIVGDVKCSDRMYDYINKYGGKAVMWKTGHSLIKEKIKSEKAPFGGELSGHIFFADRNYGYDDALYAGLRVVEILSKTGKKLSELLSDMPTAFNTPEIRIDTTEEKKHSIVETLVSKFRENTDEYSVNNIDGIRVSFHGKGWALARASNTQPVLVLRFEADTQENLNMIRDKFENIVKPLL